MSGIIFTCWKVRPRPRRAIARARRPPRLAPRKVTAPRVIGSTPVTRLNVVDLPAPLGPMRPTISPDLTWKLTSLTATRPPNSLRTACTSSSNSPLAGFAFSGSAGASAQSRCRGPRGKPASDEIPQAVRLVLEHQHEGDAEDDHFVAAAGADQAWQQHLQLVVQQLGKRCACERAPYMPNAAHHRHEQILDPHLETEGTGVHRALEMGEQPSGHGSEQRGDHEDDDLVAERADAHRLGHQRTAAQCAHGAAGP